MGRRHRQHILIEINNHLHSHTYLDADGIQNPDESQLVQSGIRGLIRPDLVQASSDFVSHTHVTYQFLVRELILAL